MFRKLDLFPSSGKKGEEDTYSVGPLRKRGPITGPRFAPNQFRVPPFYSFGMNLIEITISNSSSIILCLSIAAETCVNFVATVWFPNVYNFWFSYPWKTCSVTSRFPRSSFSAATYLSVRFLEMAHVTIFAQLVGIFLSF
jgi:hypothetical protein